LRDEFNKELQYEISQIDKLFNEGKPLLDLIKLKDKPDFIEKSAAGLFLNSFYSGIENIIFLSLKEFNIKLPNDISWHKTLLEMTIKNNKNMPVLFQKDNKEKLEEYMRFRHFIRHSYGFNIDINRLKPLINNSIELWDNLKKDIDIFKKSLF